MFLLKDYETLLADFFDLEYVVKSFFDAAPDKKHLILRHDVDLSLELAAEMAQLEASMNVHSSYFVLMRSDFYNPNSSECSKQIRYIKSLGHEIGLHYDPSLYELDDADQIKRTAASEADFLSEITGAPVRLLSFHRPATVQIDWKISFENMLHTHEPRIMENFGYCSDSRGVWRYGHPLEHATVKASKGLQLLTHPIWWTLPGSSPAEKLLTFQARHAEGIRKAVLKNHEAALKDN